MAAADPCNLLDRLSAAGLTLTPDGDRLLVSPKAKLTDPLRELLREHKPELLTWLRRRAEAERLAERARREIGWGDADVADFLGVSFRDNPHWAVVALAEVLDLVQRERQRARKAGLGA